jgi:hypothetical protein
VDRPDEQSAELIEDLWTDNLRSSLGDAVSELGGSPLCEGEGHDAGSRFTRAEKFCNSLRDDLGLARSGAGDDLQVAATVLYGVERFALELWCRHGQHRRTVHVRAALGDSAEQGTCDGGQPWLSLSEQDLANRFHERSFFLRRGSVAKRWRMLA